MPASPSFLSSGKTPPLSFSLSIPFSILTPQINLSLSIFAGGRRKWRKRKRGPPNQPPPRRRRRRRPEDNNTANDLDHDDSDPAASDPAPHETEVLDGWARHHDFPPVVLRAVNRPHSSVLAIAAVERANHINSSGDGKGLASPLVLENVSHGQLQALWVVPADCASLDQDRRLLVSKIRSTRCLRGSMYSNPSSLINYYLSKCRRFSFGEVCNDRT